MTKKHSLLVDATGSIVKELNGKEIFYFAFISFDRSLKMEPVPHMEVLTDRATFNTLEFVLSTFLEDEKKNTDIIQIACPFCALLIVHGQY